MSTLASLAEACGAKIISYADNTQLIFTCENGADFDGEKVRSCLTMVFNWLNRNQLNCNSEKSEIVFFGSPSVEDLETMVA